jgi:glucose/mannose-6-phosphate isomerase
MLKDKADSARNLKRYDVIGRLYKNVGLESEVVELEGPNTFAAVFASLYLADFTAYYVSEKNKVDPTPVAMVEEFKAKLKQ